ncbi:Kunitz/Bovine pancreatic trypsin inhibitor domain protein [Teladorsagia circumcincta]|uniref:Kunitz/Bovine pancreatic trypsin inhibitor domain protein n=1 Tax=Teladorsagia circumcincta TaxID=45464 RepID=A0A2G9V544_TELCI|nr:Kunitz/Bovine pancreatic trypsin inhibitor domain protein [Teladorsagia circumcincta]
METIFRLFKVVSQLVKGISVDPCTLDQESGVGSVQLIRYYFNKQLKLCEEFIYFGAGGNRNNFLTMEECQAQCPGGDDFACVREGLLDICVSSRSVQAVNGVSAFFCIYETSILSCLWRILVLFLATTLLLVPN